MRDGDTNRCPRCYAQQHRTVAPRRIDNPMCNEIRAAYAKSRAAPAGQIAEYIEREPGEDG